MNKFTSHVIRGKLNWAKVIGAPVYNEYAKAKQWSVDVSPDAKGLAELKKLKLASKIKDKKDFRGNFISFRQNELKKDGSPADPITITNVRGHPWPSNEKIGNGSVADVKFSYCDYGDTQGSYIRAIRILEHVPYVVQEFAPLSEDDKFFAGEDEAPEAPAQPISDPELDDDVPF